MVNQRANPELAWQTVFKEAYRTYEQNRIALLVQQRDYIKALEETLALPMPSSPTSIGGGRIYSSDEENIKCLKESGLRSRVIEQGMKYILEKWKADQMGDGK